MVTEKDDPHKDSGGCWPPLPDGQGRQDGNSDDRDDYLGDYLDLDHDYFDDYLDHDHHDDCADDHYWSLQPNNDLRLMQGLSIKSLKHHVALQPLAIIMGVGIAFVAAYIGRCVVRCCWLWGWS